MKEITNDLNIYSRTYLIEQIDKELTSLQYDYSLSRSQGKSSFRHSIYIDTVYRLEQIRSDLIQQEFLALVKTLHKV